MTRRFLFLQGPPGAFFAALARRLAGAGHGVMRIDLCGGDRADWPRSAGPRHAYRGPADGWAGHLRIAIARHGITDIVLFGDCRPAHRDAVRVAAATGVRVHVFEEGYLRPDRVTLELGGVNGHSRLPRATADYLRHAASLADPPPPASVAAPMRERVVAAIRHYGATALLAPAYPHHRGHRPHGALREAVGWSRKLARGRADRRGAADALRALRGRSFFLLPLQLEADHQLRVHSRHGGMAPALDDILRSFARSAPADALLVVKDHPLDNGLCDWRRTVERRAAALDIGKRVIHLAAGDIAHLVAHARGVVTVNSTTGTLALARGVPVVVLGDAVYDLPGITHQAGLDRFWHAPLPPRAEAFAAFRRVLAHRCLLHGGFHSRAGRAALLPHAVARLLDPVDAARDNPSLDRCA